MCLNSCKDESDTLQGESKSNKVNKKSKVYVFYNYLTHIVSNCFFSFFKPKATHNGNTNTCLITENDILKYGFDNIEKHGNNLVSYTKKSYKNFVIKLYVDFNCKLFTLSTYSDDYSIHQFIAKSYLIENKTELDFILKRGFLRSSF